MYPFWNKIVEPVLQAAGARRVVEIGALRGDTTVRLLELLGPESELHVIDPVPIFDPTEHARRFPGRYVFHRDISHNVLPDLPPADAALIDGDHNWFTVYHELRMLRETAGKSGTPMPLLIMHDVCWPYGRRDLYYAPERIPEEFRQSHDTRGILPGRKELVQDGGLNQQLENAVEEGGPRNGVMTALDVFVAAGRHLAVDVTRVDTLHDARRAPRVERHPVREVVEAAARSLGVASHQLVVGALSDRHCLVGRRGE